MRIGIRIGMILMILFSSIASSAGEMSIHQKKERFLSFPYIIQVNKSDEPLMIPENDQQKGTNRENASVEMIDNVSGSGLLPIEQSPSGAAVMPIILPANDANVPIALGMGGVGALALASYLAYKFRSRKSQSTLKSHEPQLPLKIQLEIQTKQLLLQDIQKRLQEMKEREAQQRERPLPTQKDFRD